MNNQPTFSVEQVGHSNMKMDKFVIQPKNHDE
eukprot:CAMPEP_0201564070 /NCGR_PEP_ID=MMETSP0190_2-20130828/1932_1 /ASSEMBLY_ACC=CAM_ASM_000263 /TAXON_ID=37353 /ORGANISM="Rosalina sp." /LENGTH=31 /DNA_ID= /DNA_START= /DNA_END= /DNA_ORIENTATION=